MKSIRLLAAVLAAFSAVASAGAQAKTTDPDAIVKALYKAHTAGTGPFHQTQDRALVDKYFHKDLADLIWKDAAIANGKVGALEFDPLYGSEEIQINHFIIMETDWGGDKKFGREDEAAVEVTFRNAGKPEMVSFQFERDQSKTWKIRDIRYTDGRMLSEILGGGQAGRR
jgi:hypothetical protein